MKKLNNFNIDIKLENRNIKRLDDYINSNTKIRFQCLEPTCNNMWYCSPSWILNNHLGCPMCSCKKSEKYIFNFIKNNVKFDKFIHHTKFIFNNRKYYPDFYIEKNNRKIIIEYNGIQHYKPVRFNSISQEQAEINFIKQKNRDDELKLYCKDNNIEFIEIAYNYNLKKNNRYI